MTHRRRYNKHVASLVAVLLMSTIAYAQPILTRWAESKKVEPAFLDEGYFLGEYQGLYCWAGEGRREQKQIVLLDQNLEPIRAAVLKHEGDCRILAATAYDGYASLLVENRNNTQAVVSMAVVELDSMQRMIADGKDFAVLDSMTYNKKDRCYTWAAVSQNRKYMAYINIIEYPERGQYSARARLMDSRMQVLWTKDYAMGSIDDICVTNDGTIVTLATEQDGPECFFIFNVMDRNMADTYETKVKCDPIQEMRLAGVVDRHAICLGTFLPGDERPELPSCGGVAALSFDIDSAKISGFMMRPFQNEDMNILRNTKTKKLQRDQVAELVSICDVAPTSFGGVIALGCNYQRRITENNGQITNRYHRVGLHLVAVDTEGNVKWLRNLRRNDIQMKSDDRLTLSFIGLEDGSTLVLKSEHPKYPAIYDIAKEAKEFDTDSKGNLVMYKIAPDGEVEKTIIENKTNQSHIKTMRRTDGALLILTAHGHRSRLAELKLQ